VKLVRLVDLVNFFLLKFFLVSLLLLSQLQGDLFLCHHLLLDTLHLLHRLGQRLLPLDILLEELLAVLQGLLPQQLLLDLASGVA